MLAVHDLEIRVGARVLMEHVNFRVADGDKIGLVGRNGAGKTTLTKVLAGETLPTGGRVDRSGEIGYLPQDLQLFDGTIAENISRFRQDAASGAIIEAATLADVHDMIVALPDGYNTVIGRAGRNLSAGQRQRIALARALYGNPFLIVLDEPNSNLDAEGEAALVNAIKTMRDRKSIVVVIAHRPSAIATVDKILCLQEGRMTAFGPKEEVLKKVVQPVPAARSRS